MAHVLAEPLLLVQPNLGISLAKSAGVAFLAMSRACFAEVGVGLTIFEYGGYRTPALQHAMHVNPAAYKVAAGVTIADTPNGTHEDGTCVDIVGSSSLTASLAGRWLRSGGGARFGFVADSIAGDPTHWHHLGGTSTAGSGSTVLTDQSGEIMQLAIASTAGPVAIWTPLSFDNLSRFAQAQALARLQFFARFNPGGALLMVSPSEYQVAFEQVVANRADVFGAIANTVDAALKDNFDAIDIHATPGEDPAAWLAALQPELDKISAAIPTTDAIAAAVDAAAKDDFAALQSQLAAIAAATGKTPADVLELLGKSISNG